MSNARKISQLVVGTEVKISNLDSDVNNNLNNIISRLDSDDAKLQSINIAAAAASSVAGISDSDLKVVADLRNDLDSEITYVRNIRLSYTNYLYNATAGQTTFQDSDSNSATLAYTAGSITVFLNGIKLEADDFTATDGTSIVLTQPAGLSSQLSILCPKLESNITTTSSVSYDWSSGTQQAKLTQSDPANNDRFGYELAISGDGNYALVGAYQKASGKGAAYIFLKSGSTWSQQAKLEASDGSSNDNFGMGCRISEDGDTAVVGAKGAGSGINGTGKIYVYTRSGTSWSQQASITASDAADGDLFGYAVDISDDGDTIVVGAYGEDTGGNARGQMYVYTRSGSTWSEQQKFQSSDVEDGDNFGFAVAISGDGDNIIAGVPFEDTSGSGAGSGYIFTRSGTTWSQQAKIQASDAAGGSGEAGQQLFGYSVSMNTDGNTIALGSRDDTGGTNRGAAFVFTRSGSTWSQQAKIENANEADYDLFGSGKRGVSLDGSGDVLVVGAYSDDDSGSQSGSTFVYQRDGTTWSLSKQLATSDAAAADENGWSVALDKDGDTLLTSSYSKNSARGAVYVFTAPTS